MRIDPNKPVAPVESATRSPAHATVPTKGDEPAAVVTLGATTKGAGEESDAAIEARIERVRSLLARGAYPIDLDQLASRIAEDEVARWGQR